MSEKQELYCHNCNMYVQFEMDMELNGNHVLNCPNCGHEHCRVVKDGVITDDRWDSRNPVVPISDYTMTVSANSTYVNFSSTSNTTSSASVFIYSSWMNSTTITRY